MKFQVRDHDLSAFLAYAARERSLDASMRAADRFGASEEHRRTISALREFNRKMLMHETRHLADEQ